MRAVVEVAHGVANVRDDDAPLAALYSVSVERILSYSLVHERERRGGSAWLTFFVERRIRLNERGRECARQVFQQAVCFPIFRRRQDDIPAVTIFTP